MSSLWFLVVLASLRLFTCEQSEGERAHNLMLDFPLIDGHNDFAFQLRKLYNNRLSQVDLHNVSELRTDIGRLRSGHVRAQLFAAYIMCGAQQKDAVRLTLEQVDVLRRMCAEYQELELVTSTQELLLSSGRGSIGCLISVEGGHSLDSSLATLRTFYQLGVRSMALTHNCNTPWATSSSKLYHVYNERNTSLTDFGKAVVEEMNRLGMIIDLSHSSWETASSALQLSKAPVIFSHSSSYQLCPHHRNVPDWLLHKLRDNRGVIMVNFYTDFITCRDDANVSDVADHFDHLRRVIGAQYIGIGGDFEGVERFPQGLEDVSKYPNLIQELLRRGWKEDDLADVLQRNFMRVFKEVERVRDELSSSPPSEEQIPTELVQNPCRMVLRPPDQRPRSLNSAPRSRAHHGPKVLVTINAALLLSSLLNTLSILSSY